MAKDHLDLEEIKRRQQQLVEMKKIKQGQMEAPQVDLEAEKIVPHTAKEKRQNFWYHYKWVTIGSVLVTALLIFFIADMVTKDKYDITIMAFNQYQNYLSTDVQEKTFEQFAADTDGNGEVNVLVNGAQTYPSGSTSSGAIVDPQMAQVASTKLFAGMQTFEGFIFLMDDGTYDSIVTDAETGKKADIFLDLSQYSEQNAAFQGDKLYLKDTQLAKDWGFKEVPDDLFLCLRDFDKYDAGKETNRVKKLRAQYAQEKEVFDKIIESVLKTPASEATASDASGK
ncbi:MAG: hypothetical protein PUB00_05135 [Clostridiales bacterium]|nr:hypothetical protein [Clostridiales bacterium]